MSAIHIEPAAAREILRLQTYQGRQNQYIRLSLQPGGCADRFYKLAFCAAIAPGDRPCESAGISILIPSQDLPYLEGLAIDYSEDLMGGGFRFYNPRTPRTCSCGQSFYTVDGDGTSSASASHA